MISDCCMLYVTKPHNVCLHQSPTLTQLLNIIKQEASDHYIMLNLVKASENNAWQSTILKGAKNKPHGHVSWRQPVTGRIKPNKRKIWTHHILQCYGSLCIFRHQKDVTSFIPTEKKKWYSYLLQDPRSYYAFAKLQPASLYREEVAGLCLAAGDCISGRLRY